MIGLIPYFSAEGCKAAMSYRLPSCCTFVIALIFALVSDVGRSAAEEPAPTIAPTPTAWAIRPPLADPKEAENISGAACYQVNGSRKSCLLAGDEADTGKYARFFAIDDHTIVPGPIITLLPKEEHGQKMKETDVEGVSFADSYYYLIGSHGLSKKGAEFQPSRFFVYRFRVDAETGMPGFPFGGETPAPEVERSDRLRAVIAATPELQGYAEKPLDEHGVNIEGLAVRSDRLFLGFRGPVLNGKALVMSVNIDAAFGNAPARPQVYPINLGDGMGVRDLATVADGFLVLSGPEADEPGEADLFFWDGQSAAPARLGMLGGVPDHAKPEAVLVLAEDMEAYRLLIMSDGIPGGAPTEYRVPKPKR
jgi:Protein of unknown function (DUF3616)